MPLPPRLTPVGPVIRAQDAALWADAAAALAEARLYADQTRAWAQAAYEKERERGYAEGWSAGAEDASRCVAATAARTERYLRGLERDLPALVIDVVERILGSFDPGEVL
jgi:type III secretion protein L